MTLDWNHFTPWASLAGGIVLGLASAIFILMNGRILGISGIIGGLLRPRRGDVAWRLSFVLGMLAAGDTAETLLEGYPWLEPEDIQACLVYARRLVGHERIEPNFAEFGA